MRLFALKVPESLPEDTMDRLLHHLPERAQDRVRAFRHEADAVRSLAARLLPTWYLRASGLVPAPAHPAYAHHPRGKPYLVAPALDPAVEFNTSHEGAYVLLAVVHGAGESNGAPAAGEARGGEREAAAAAAPGAAKGTAAPPLDVGVDVMDLPGDPDELAESIGYQLTAHERALVAAARGRIKAKLLTTLWTIKEGYTKATGDGISFGLDRIAVDLGDGAVAGVRVDGRDVRDDGWLWAVGSIQGGDYGYAVIWRGDADARTADGVRLETLPWDQFVRSFIGGGCSH